MVLQTGQILDCLNWVSRIALLFFRLCEFPNWCFIRGSNVSSGHCTLKNIAGSALGYFRGEITTPLRLKSGPESLWSVCGFIPGTLICGNLDGFMVLRVCYVSLSSNCWPHSSILLLNGCRAVCSTGSQMDMLQFPCWYPDFFFFHSLFSLGSTVQPLQAKLNGWSRREMLEFYKTENQKLLVDEFFVLCVEPLHVMFYCKGKSDGEKVCRLCFLGGYLEKRWVPTWLASGRL